MELTKKTTILFSPALYDHLVRVARRRRTSVGHLVRTACEAQYGDLTTEERLQAVRDIARISLPTGSPAQMKRQSTPHPDDLLP